MKCKHCQAEMPDDGVFCPYCGKSNAEEAFDTAAEVEQILLEEDEAVVIVSDEEPQQQEPSEVEEVIASPQVKKMKRVAIFSGCLAVLAILGTVLFFGVRGGLDGTGEGWDVASWFAWMKPRQDSLLGNDSYSVSDKKAWSKRAEVVATMGDAELTNGQLQVYYWMQVLEFMDSYGNYLSYLGMDYTKPLDEQSSMEEGMTWQQYFLESALEMWHSNQAFATMAQENGFELDETYQGYLDTLRTSIEENALENDYESADAMLQEEMGPGCNLDDYLEYTRVYYTGYLYFSELYDALDPTDADVEKYFADNAESFTEQGIAKDSGKYYSIRHIQFTPEGGTKDDAGNVTYSDDEWEACRQKAQALMDSWTAGEISEETFIKLVADNSDDSYSSSNGGLYSDFAKGAVQSVYGETMETWCTAEERQAGDYVLLRSDVGYHMVYFVESQDIWYAEAMDALMNELGADLLTDAMENYPIEVNYKKIVLGVVDFG